MCGSSYDNMTVGDNQAGIRLEAPVTITANVFRQQLPGYLTVDLTSID